MISGVPVKLLYNIVWNLPRVCSKNLLLLWFSERQYDDVLAYLTGF